MKKAERTCPEKNQDQIGDVKTSTDCEMKLNGMPQIKRRAPIICTLFSAFAYIILFAFLYYIQGQAMAISAIIPVIAVGWFYGFKMGIYAAILSFPINIFMYELFGLQWFRGMVGSGGGITGTFGLIIIGATVGRIRDLSKHLSKELCERKQIEKELKTHRDRLDEMVKLKTEELQMSNKNLRETKDHLDNVIDSSLDCIIIADNIGNISRVNESFLELIGYQLEEIKGMHVMELSITKEGKYESTSGEIVEIDEDFFNEAKKMTYEKLFKDGKITNWETHYLRKDQRIVPVEMNVAYLYNKEGEPIGSVGINRDITVRRKIEKEIKESKDFLENIFKTAADGIIVTDNEGSITMVNGTTVNMLGYSQSELIGKSTSVLNPQGKHYEEVANQYLTKLFEESIVTAFELTYSKKDGTFIDAEVNTALLKDNKGNVTGSVANIRDITERKKNENKLRETKEYLDNLIESSLDGIIVSDEVGHVIRVNKSFLELIGFEEEEAIGKHIMELSIMKEGRYESTTGELIEINKEFFNDTMEMSVQLYGEGKVSHWESFFLHKGGKIVPTEMRIAHLYNEPGDVIGSVGIIRDITDRKKSEKDIKDAKDFLEYVIKSSRDGIMVTDDNGLILSINISIEKMSGYTREELIGEHASVFATDDEAMNEMIHKKTAEMYEKGFCFYESKLKTKNGNTTDVECSCSMIKNDKGNDVGAVSIIRDITERKNIEKQLLQSEKLKSLGELSGGVAHDFNNVLAAILGRVQLLRMQFKPPEGKQEKRKSMLDLTKSLKIIERASLDGAETVRRIQEFSRKRVDDKEFTKIDMNELIDDALEFTSVRWKNDAESKGITITIQKEFSPLPPTSGSASELREVFTNLIHNAIDAMPQGGRIKIRTFKENGHISITIEDNGIGISEALRNRIFDPFFTTKGVQSTGLGMSVSYGIINRHGGTIRVDSTEGKGTNFTITLPISDNIRVDEEKTKPIPEEKRKSRILVIEDEEEVRNLLADILIENGHQVETASDGSQGIDMLKKRDFDMVFTDLGMPGTSGWEVAETVKSINERIPVAIITGWNVELKESEMRERGVNLIAYKPFKIDHILRLVQEGMELKEQFEAA